MPFKSQRAQLTLTADENNMLRCLSQSRTKKASIVERAKILLCYTAGETVSGIARKFLTNRPKIERCIDKALQFGIKSALDDLQRSGKPATITPEARSWVVSLSCQKPTELGYSHEMWTMNLLAKHIQSHCGARGYPFLGKISKGTVSNILKNHNIRPHKIAYYCERRDPEFEPKMAQVLYFYKEIQMLQEKKKTSPPDKIIYLSYDEKPGIQAIENKAPDLPPVPDKHSNISRDTEYIRHGTLSLLSGIDLLTGHIHAQVKERHRSKEFIEFLKQIDGYYPTDVKIKMVLDNHSAHISKETRKYLATVPNRFNFVYTPKHGSWLNIIESFFSKLARTVLRGIRVRSKAELKNRLYQYFNEINNTPVIFRWKYKLDTISIV